MARGAATIRAAGELPLTGIGPRPSAVRRQRRLTGNSARDHWWRCCYVAATSADRVFTAVFDALAAGGGGNWTGKLSIGRTNTVEVSCDVGGISFGSACSAKFEQRAGGLNATPPAGKSFGGWDGASSGTALLCSLPITAEASVQANFNK